MILWRLMHGLCRAEDDLTHKLAEIIKANKALKAQEEAGSPQHIIREFANLLQFHITTYFDNTKPGIPVAQQRSGRCACSQMLNVLECLMIIRYVQGRCCLDPPNKPFM